MNPFSIIVGLIMLTGALFYVAAPFRSGTHPVKSHKKASNTSQLLQTDHQAVILALRDLDFDYRAGKISDEDYQETRTRLLEKAAFNLKEVEQSDARLEKLIQARRKLNEPAAKTGVTDADPGHGICVSCQAPLREGANFCMKCGTAVPRAICPQCGNPIQPDDQFCPACGKAIVQVAQLSNTNH